MQYWDTSILIKISNSEAVQMNMAHKVHALTKDESYEEKIVNVGNEVFVHKWVNNPGPESLLIKWMEKVKWHKKAKEKPVISKVP